jgi:integral membrane sensor domain MASE1
MSQSKLQISLSTAFIGVCLIGMAIFASHGKYAIAYMWFPCLMVIALWGLKVGISMYKRGE